MDSSTVKQQFRFIELIKLGSSISLFSNQVNDLLSNKKNTLSFKSILLSFN